MPSSILEQAKKQFVKGNYQQVINLLEPHVTQYVVSSDTKDVVYNASFNKSFPFYLYLGLACLHAGDICGAVDYLACARKIKMTPHARSTIIWKRLSIILTMNWHAADWSLFELITRRRQ